MEPNQEEWGKERVSPFAMIKSLHEMYPQGQYIPHNSEPCKPITIL